MSSRIDFAIYGLMFKQQSCSLTVHGKTTDGWHTNDIRVRTSNILMIYKYIRVTYWWHTSDIQITHEYIWVAYRWHTSLYEWHTNDIRVTYGWHAVQKKNKVNFFKAFHKFSFKISESLACNGCFGVFTKIKKMSGISFWCTFSTWFFHTNTPYLIVYQCINWQSFNVTSFFYFSRYQTKYVTKFFF